jgi:uncharacterized membrane protein ArfB
MPFLVGWLVYLAAFLAGSLVAWCVIAVAITHTSEQEVLDSIPGAQR